MSLSILELSLDAFGGSSTTKSDDKDDADERHYHNQKVVSMRTPRQLRIQIADAGHGNHLDGHVVHLDAFSQYLIAFWL